MSNEQEYPHPSVPRAWRDLACICEELHARLYRDGDQESALRLLPNLETLLNSVPESEFAIVRAEALGLYHELRGEMSLAIQHRKREITLLQMLHEDIEKNAYDAETKAYLLNGHDVSTLEERIDIVKALESRLGIPGI